MENNTANMVLIPEENVYINFEITEDKPFNKCFSCNSFRNGCSGPNLFAMGVKRACEFLQMARMYLRRLYPDKYSYQYCADETGLGITTIKKTSYRKNRRPQFLYYEENERSSYWRSQRKVSVCLPRYCIRSRKYGRARGSIRKDGAACQR